MTLRADIIIRPDFLMDPARDIQFMPVWDFLFIPTRIDKPEMNRYNILVKRINSNDSCNYSTLTGGISMATKYVYMFTEGNASMRNLLGGKGAGLAEMTGLGLPVPQGFTITTEACTK